MNVRCVLAVGLLGLGCSDPAFAVANPAGTDGDSATHGDAPGAGLSCTNMEQCAADGLVCISHAVDGCTEGACLRRYTCEVHPSFDKCTAEDNCVDIACVTLADCPDGSNFCVGEMATDSATPAGVPTVHAVGLITSKCSAGTPAREPKQSFSGDTLDVFLCTNDGECVMSDGTHGTCCPTGNGISYCATICAVH